MNILFDIGHPGQVHLFRHVIKDLMTKGHKVIVTVKEIKAAQQLLDAFQIPWISLGKKYDSILLKGFTQLKYNYNLYKIARKENIDIAVGSSITIAHVSKFHKLKSIVLDDDDSDAVKLFSLFAHPFADCILSPMALSHDRKRKKDIVYEGTHELFYLHPSYFKPDINVITQLGMDVESVFFILRFVSGKAYHDSGQKWLSIEQKLRIVKMLEPYGKVFITTEREIESELKQWQLNLSPEKIHSLIYYATLFLGDSQTMTSEAAILGTPALKCNTFAGKLSVPNELEEKYGLCYSYQPVDFKKFYNHVEQYVKTPNIKEEWREKRERFLADKIDVTSFMVWFIENYPQSKQIMKEDPNYQYNFR